MISLSEKNFRKILVALTIYLVSLFAANTLGLKFMPFVFGTHLSVAVFCFPVVFLMTDVVGEVFGKKIARWFVLSGFIATALFIGYSLLSLSMPWSKDAMWVHDSYNQVFGVTVRIALASLTAFAVAEYQDVFSFFFLRRKIGTKMFWLRSNLSNLWSQFLDTTIFMIIAFAGVFPVKTLVMMIIPWWLFKVSMGIVYTPLSYLGIKLLKGKDEKVEN